MNEPSSNPQAVDPSEILIRWANASDEWIRRIVQIVLATGARLSEEDCDSVFALFLEEKKFNDRDLPREPKIPSTTGDRDQDIEFTLNSISEVRNVNALDPDTSIEFGPGLTILYGENGTGKTGYSRILKCLANSRSVEDILPNMHQPRTSSDPAAKIGYALDSEHITLDWSGELGIDPFTKLSVFDAPALNLHVDQSIGYTYTPTSLALFSHVTHAVQAIQVRIESEVLRLRQSPTDLRARFNRETSLYSAIDRLSAITDLEELKAHALDPEDSAERIAELKRSLAMLRADVSDPLVALKTQTRKALVEAGSFANAVRHLENSRYNKKLEALLELREDYVTIRQNLFAAADLPAPPDESWESFIRAGYLYRSHLEHLGAADEERCLYCRQVLSDDAASLLQKYGSYINDQLAHQIEHLETSLRESARPLLESSLPQVRVLVDAATDDSEPAPGDTPSLLGPLRLLLDGADDIRSDLEAERSIRTESADAVLRQQQFIARTISQVAGEIEDLNKQRADQGKLEREKELELLDLEDRVQLFRSWTDVSTRVNSLERANRLDGNKGDISAVLRKITNLAKEATEGLTDRNFAELFEEECSELGAPSVELEFIGRKGETQRKKVVSRSHPPSAILSEGEQKALALADFIAEARLRTTTSPIVFDDPISSLDHRRTKEVATRITKLAVEHQIVVFTHDIFFTSCLLEQLEESERCRFYQVTDEEAIGRVMRSTGPRTDTIKSLRAKINETIEGAKQHEGDSRAELVRLGYGYLRSWCEIFVESEMLARVTERYQPNVRITSLNNIKVAVFAQARDVVVRVFEDACRYIDSHSQPMATLYVAPTLTRLEHDWQSVRACRKQYLDATTQ